MNGISNTVKLKKQFIAPGRGMPPAPAVSTAAGAQHHPMQIDPIASSTVAGAKRKASDEDDERGNQKKQRATLVPATRTGTHFATPQGTAGAPVGHPVSGSDASSSGALSTPLYLRKKAKEKAAAQQANIKRAQSAVQNQIKQRISTGLRSQKRGDAMMTLARLTLPPKTATIPAPTDARPAIASSAGIRPYAKEQPATSDQVRSAVPRQQTLHLPTAKHNSGPRHTTTSTLGASLTSPHVPSSRPVRAPQAPANPPRYSTTIAAAASSSVARPASAPNPLRDLGGLSSSPFATMNSIEKIAYIRDKLPHLPLGQFGVKAHSAILKSWASYNKAANDLSNASHINGTSKSDMSTLENYKNGYAAEVIETLRLATVHKNNPTWLKESQEWLNAISRKPDLTLDKPSVDKTGKKIPGTYVDIKNGIVLESARARKQLMELAAVGNLRLVSGSSSSHLFPSIHYSKSLMHESVRGRANETLLRDLERRATEHGHTFLLRTTSMTEGALVSVEQAKNRAALHETDSAAFDQGRDNSPESAGAAGMPAAQESANSLPAN